MHTIKAEEFKKPRKFGDQDWIQRSLKDAQINQKTMVVIQEVNGDVTYYKDAAEYESVTGKQL